MLLTIHFVTNLHSRTNSINLSLAISPCSKTDSGFGYSSVHPFSRNHGGSYQSHTVGSYDFFELFEGNRWTSKKINHLVLATEEKIDYCQ